MKALTKKENKAVSIFVGVIAAMGIVVLILASTIVNIALGVK